MKRIGVGLGAAAMVLACGTSAATAQQVWQAGQANDEFNQPGAYVFLGVPETDDITLSARCSASAPSRITLDLYVNSGGVSAGRTLEVYFTFGNTTIHRTGTIIDTEAGPSPTLSLSRNDDLWGNLRAASAVSIQVAGPDNLVTLRGSNAAITQFFAYCDRAWGIVPAAAPAPTAPTGAATIGNVPSQGQALIGPLFVVGQQPLRAFTNFTGGQELPAFAPGTELMATNRTGSSNGAEWAEVATLRGAGVTAFVQRSLLVPVSGGATEYQNLNQAANLVIRSQPNSSAGVAGSVPPNARGIFDQGQRSGNYVLVRYGNLTGWASHDYLLPILTGAGSGAPAGVAPAGVAPAGVAPAAVAPAATPVPTVAATGKPLPQAGTGGAVGDSDAMFVGRWYQVLANQCMSCTLDVTDIGPSLSLTAAEGWVANLIAGVDGDPGYATGQGFWSGGAYAGQSASVDAINDGFNLIVTMYLADGRTVELRFAR